jgi:hypothetical protein
MTYAARSIFVCGILLAGFGLSGCREDRLIDVSPQAAKGGAGGGSEIRVAAVNPSRGEQGTVDLDVTITGSGFAAGAEASWELGGAPSQKVVVTQTRYVSAKEVIATIQIAEDADLAFYDVAVTNPDRKKGISTESFKVSPEGVDGEPLLELAGESTLAFGTNGTYTVGRINLEDGTIKAAVWTPTGRITLGEGTASGINAAGVIVGSSGVNAGGHAIVWRPAGAGSWLDAEALPQPAGSWNYMVTTAINDQGQIAGYGRRSDGVDQALRWNPDGAGGYAVELIPLIPNAARMNGASIANGTGHITGTVSHDVGNGFYQNDGFVWTGSGEALILPRYMVDQAVEAKGINAFGVVVGFTNVPNGTSPLKWEPNGSGYSTPAVLPTLASVANYPWGINDAGDIVSTSGEGVAYLCGRIIQLRSPAGWKNNYAVSISADGKVAVGRTYDGGRKVKGITQIFVHATRWDLSEFSCH